MADFLFVPSLFFLISLLISKSFAEKSSSIVTLPSHPLVPGDKIGHFQLEGRLDSLGIEKLFVRDHGYFGIAPPNDHSTPDQINEQYLDNIGEDLDDRGEREITPLDEIHVDMKDSSIKNGDYYLNRKIFLGGHGEIWLAKKILENGNIELNTSYVLKRMHLKDRPAILRCALREIYFGDLLQSNSRTARFITHFRLNEDYWLVFYDEGVSLQSILYALTVDRGLPAFEPSGIWKRMRTTSRGEESMKSILYQIFLGVASLHRQGIIHRDIKPSNILINAQSPLSNTSSHTTIRLLIADFSSAVNDQVIELGFYGAQGPTTDEESEQYQPPETLFSCQDFEQNEGLCPSVPFDKQHPESYDSWSIGVLFAEMILGTANIFNVDQRTSALISHRMRHASKEQQEEALKLAAMAEMCIYRHSHKTRSIDDEENEQEKLSIVRMTLARERAIQISKKYLNPTDRTFTCGILELERALQRRDPLGIGYHNKAGLDLLSRLLKWDPAERISVREALTHAFFVGPYVSPFDGSEHMTQQDMDAYDAELILQETLYPDLTDIIQFDTTPAMIDDTEQVEDIDEESIREFSEQLSSLLTFTDSYITHDSPITLNDTPSVIASDLTHDMTFQCPSCQRKFVGSWRSCSQHVLSRKHGTRCVYNPHWLPPCLSSHSLLPIDPHSGWCDLQGRRKYIEDAHAVVFTNDYKFFGVFDGHFGNRAAIYASRHIQHLFEEFYSGKLVMNHKNAIKHSPSIVQPLDASQEWKDLYLPILDDMKMTLVHQVSNLLENEEMRSHTVHEVMKFLQSSFVQTNDDFLQTNSDSSSGTTATISIMFSDFIFVGNIGDSRAVLCCDWNGQAIQLTVDHTPYVQQESERILSSGGTIDRNVSKDDILRVNNVLAVSRSIGDSNYRQVLSSEPDLLLFRRSSPSKPQNFFEFNITSNNFCLQLSKFHHLSSQNIPQLFLVLGSDGLWDVIDNQQVVEYICESLLTLLHKHYQEFGEYQLPVDSFQIVARDISREAYVRGSMDNIGVCVIDLTS